MTLDIQSPSNRRIVETARLRKRRQRDATGRFLIEGTREMGHAIASGATIEEVFVCPALASRTAIATAQEIAEAGARRSTVSPEAFDRLSARQKPDGIIGVGLTWDTPLASIDRDVVLVAEAIEKPGNLGAMLRTADAVGSALIVADPTVDPFNPNVVRASQGAVFTVRFAVADVRAAEAWARDHGSIVVASPEGTIDYWDADLTGPISFVIGSEHHGVSPTWRNAGAQVRIPMRGAADSLNASVAAAVLLYESARQNRSKQSTNDRTEY